MVADWRTVRSELEAYGGGLAGKPEILALNKADALGPDARKAKVAALKKTAKRAPRVVSGVSGEGVSELLRAAYAEVTHKRPAATPADEAPPDDNGWRP